MTINLQLLAGASRFTADGITLTAFGRAERVLTNGYRQIKVEVEHRDGLIVVYYRPLFSRRTLISWHGRVPTHHNWLELPEAQNNTNHTWQCKIQHCRL